MRKNLILIAKPKVAEQWDYEKNLNINIEVVTSGSEKSYWWKCSFGHSWQEKVCNRKTESCPICSNKRILVGYNDLWTTHPEIAKYLTNSQDGFMYTHGSGKKVFFSCTLCNSSIGEKIIKNAVNKGVRCTKCNYTGSLGERMMSSIFDQVNIKYKTQKTFPWLKNRRYDFFIEELNIIVEIHGEQHYKNNFKNGRTLEEEKEIDRVKKSTALENGIESYWVVNSGESDFNFVKNNIMKSPLNRIIDFNTIDWKLIFSEVNTPTMKKVCGLYNENDSISQSEIANKLNISTATVIKYLEIASKNGFVDYTPNSEKNKKNSLRYKFIPVVKLTLDGDYVEEFENLKSAQLSVGASTSTSISKCCKGEYSHSKGFKWMFKSEYEKTR